MKKLRVRDKFIKELQNTPIVQVACDKLGISRQTYYRWLKEDASFASVADYALSQGTERVNDIAVSNVLRGIQNQSESYTKYWLNCRHPEFRRPLERIYKIPIFADADKVKKFEDDWFGPDEDKPKENTI